MEPRIAFDSVPAPSVAPIDHPHFDFAQGPHSQAFADDFTFGIVGSGGDGVITAGDAVERALSHQGLYCILTKSFGPQIRGGEALVQLRASDSPLATEGDALDLLIVLSWKDYRRFLHEVKLKQGAILILDPDDPLHRDVDLPVASDQLRHVIEVPFARLARQSGSSQNKNMIVLGVLAQIAHIPLDNLKQKIAGRFERKPKEVVDGMLAAIDLGEHHAAEHLALALHLPFMKSVTPAKCVMTGNEAIGLGALYAGCRFLAGYPITPSTEVMDFMSRYLPRYGGRAVQAEDEIAAIGMCLGASFAGVKAMTATSGPGLSLMSEMLGLASNAELPLVIANVQRVGPSTGIPTKSEQSDLLHAAFGGHGDASRVVIAPCDVEDCFDVTVKAFFIAERYQLPVIILSDQLIGQRKEAIKPEGVINQAEGFVIRNVRRQPKTLEGGFLRYADTVDDVPLITTPGTPGGTYQISGLEHDERGRPTSSFTHHDKMARRRRRKLERISREFQFLRWYGLEEADIGILAWGSSKGAVKDAVRKANSKGMSVAALIPQIVYPVPAKQIRAFVKAMKRIAVIELSSNAQFLQLIHSAVNLPRDTISYARPGANPLRVEEVLDVIEGATSLNSTNRSSP